MDKSASTSSEEKRDVDVTREAPLYITDDDREFGTVTIHPGGQVFVKTSAQVVIDKLEKKTS